MPRSDREGPELPVGVVTYMLTDVEGSTGLWEADPAMTATVIGDYERLVDDVARRHGGHVVKSRGEGDSLFVVFSLPSAGVKSALDVAIALQDGLRSRPLSVRIALHTGEGAPRGSDYYGSAVNRCARLREVAHGGQILLSQATAALARADLPEGASLQDLGEHRLRDLRDPERIYQLAHPRLAVTERPLATLDYAPNNLPAALTRLVARIDEQRSLRTLLAEHRLVTLLGAGGIGKTRLALQVAADSLIDFRDGAWLVELEQATERSMVVGACVNALDVRSPTSAGEDDLIAFLKPRTALIVLDSCERAVEACAALAVRILQACPAIKIICTSQIVLHVPGERVFGVPPLSVPQHGAEPAHLLRHGAVELFVERAIASRPSFVLTPRNAPSIAEISRRLDGIPLAIELAAARVASLSTDEIRSRLDDRFRLLASSSASSPERHRALRSAMEWSHGLLTDTEAALFRRCGVFQGWFSLAAVEDICVGDTVDSAVVHQLVAGLVDHSLLGARFDGGNSAYRMAESVRVFAQERLAEAGELQGVRDRHLSHFQAKARRNAAELSGSRQADALSDLAACWYEISAALKWAEESGQHTVGVRLALSIWRFAHLTGHAAEVEHELRCLLEAAGDRLDSSERAEALKVIGTLAYYQGRFDDAWEASLEGLGVVERLGDRAATARLLNNLGNIALARGSTDESIELFERGLALKRAEGSSADIASTSYNLAIASRDMAAFGAAEAHAKEALATYASLGNDRRQADTRFVLGLICADTGQLQEAAEHYAAALGIQQRLGLERESARTRVHLAALHTVAGRVVDGLALARESLAAFSDLGDRWGQADSLLTIGTSLRCLGDLGSSRSPLHEALQTYADVGLKRGVADAELELGSLALDLGEHDQARAHLEHALQAMQRLKNGYGIAKAHLGLAAVELETGDLVAASQHASKGISEARRVGALTVLANSLDVLACLNVKLGRLKESLTMAAAAEAGNVATGAQRESASEKRLAACLDEARAELPIRVSKAAWRAGEALTLEQAALEAEGRGLAVPSQD